VPNTELQSLWTTPSPHWGTGIDPRSSEGGLFSLFYATLERASHYQWLNAGRTLVDKTYLTILCKAQQCSMQGIQPTELASRLDTFIRGELVERWTELDDLDHETRHTLALELHSKASDVMFPGDAAGEITSSQILFYLVPQLPFFPMPADAQGSYADWHQECRGQLALALPHLTEAPLPAVYGDEKAQRFVEARLKQGDWWQRWMQLRQAA